jgi:murein DD-endopeptidase MepM/ murein hydrolase activator NlpD
VLALVMTTASCRSAARRSSPTGSFQPISLNQQPDTHATVWVPPLPAPLRVTRPFQPPPTPYASGHRGVDLAGSPGQQVRAAGDGRVTWAGVLAGRGVVVVSHGGLRTTYEPVLADVAKGRPIRAGDPLGALQKGHPGCPQTACLHWGLLRGTEYLDPLSLIRPPVRLLPLTSHAAGP